MRGTPAHTPYRAHRARHPEAPYEGARGGGPELKPCWTPRALVADDMNSVLSGASGHRGRRPGPAGFRPAVTIKRIMSEALPARGVQRFPPCRRRIKYLK